jgi:hypothetical protein
MLWGVLPVRPIIKYRRLREKKEEYQHLLTRFITLSYNCFSLRNPSFNHDDPE